MALELTQAQKNEANAKIKEIAAQGGSQQDIDAYKQEFEASVAKTSTPEDQTDTSGDTDFTSDDGSWDSAETPETQGPPTMEDFSKTAGRKKGDRFDEDGEVINLARDFGEVGELVESIPFFGDLIDDIYGSAKAGWAQGQTVDDALALFAGGEDTDPETIQKYIDAVDKSRNQPVSKEMQDFNQIYEESGGGTWGFIKAIAQNPSVGPTTIVSSMVAMLNPASAAGAGVGAGTGAAVGTLATPIGTGVGAVSGAFAGAGGVLETGSSFTEFLQEALEEKGLEFNEEGIAEVLGDEDTLASIRGRSAARGGVIAVIDGLTGGLAGKAATATAKNAKKLAKLKGALAATAVEGAGGGIGEASARLAVGQELDAREIGLEIVGEFGVGVGIAKAAFKQPAYEINGQRVKAKEVEAVLDKSPELASTLDVTNDKKLQDRVNETISDNDKINNNKEYLATDEVEARDSKLEEVRQNLESVRKAKNPEEKAAFEEAVKESRKELKQIVKEQDKRVNKLSQTDKQELSFNNKAIAKNNAFIQEQTAKYEGKEMPSNVKTAIERTQKINEDAQIGINEIRAKQEQKVKEAEAVKAEEQEQQDLEDTAVDLGITPEKVVKAKEEALEVVDEDVDTNSKVIDGISEELLDLGVDIRPAEGSVGSEFANDFVPLTKDGDTFTKGDFEKAIESYEPRTLAEVKKAEQAVKRLAKDQGFEVTTNIEKLEDGTAVLTGSVKSPKREENLSQKFTPEPEAASEQEVIPEQEISEAGNVVGSKVKDEVAGINRTVPSKKEKGETVEAQAEKKGIESVGDNVYAFPSDARKGASFVRGLERRGHAVDVDKKAKTFTVRPGEGINLNLEEGTKSEVDRIKNLPKESEDGATFNQDGTKYDGGGLVLPIASENLKASELTPERIEAFKKKHAKYLGAGSKIGIYKFPGQDQASIDLNVIVPSNKRKRAVEIGKKLGQESLFDLDTFENVKTGETGANPKTIGPSAAKRIADEFADKPSFNLEESSFKGDLQAARQEREDIRSIESKGRRTTKQATPEQLAEVEKGRNKKGAIQEYTPKEGTQEFDPSFDRKNVGKSTSPRQDLRGKGIKGKNLYGQSDKLLNDYNDGNISDNELVEKLADYTLNQVPKITTAQEGGSKISEGQAEFEGIQRSEGTRSHSRTNTALEGFALDRLTQQIKDGKFKGLTGAKALAKAKAIGKSSRSLEKTALGESKDRQRIANVARRAEQAFYAEKGYEPGLDDLSDYINDNKAKYKVDATPEKIEQARAVDLPLEAGSRVEGEARERSQTRIAKDAGLDTVTEEVLSPANQDTVDAIVEGLLAQRPEQPSAKEFQDIEFKRKDAGYSKRTQGDVAAANIKKVNTKIDQDIHNEIGKLVQGKQVAKAFPKLGEQLGFKQDSYADLTKAERQNFRRKLIDALAFESEERSGLGKPIPSPEFNLGEGKDVHAPAKEAATPEYTEKVSKALSKAFPNVDVISTQEGFNNYVNELQRAGITLPPGIKGLQHGHKIAINPSKATKDTAIHEFGHIWSQQLMRSNPKLWKRGVELLKGSEYMRVIADNPHYKAYLKESPSKFYEEVMANALGKRGAEIFAKNQEKAGAWDKFINKVGDWLKKKLDISSKKDYMDLTLDDWLNIGATSILSGDKSAFSGKKETKSSNPVNLSLSPSVSEVSNILNDDADAIGFLSAAEDIRVSDIAKSRLDNGVLTYEGINDFVDQIWNHWGKTDGKPNMSVDQVIELLNSVSNLNSPSQQKANKLAKKTARKAFDSIEDVSDIINNSTDKAINAGANVIGTIGNVASGAFYGTVATSLVSILPALGLIANEGIAGFFALTGIIGGGIGAVAGLNKGIKESTQSIKDRKSQAAEKKYQKNIKRSNRPEFSLEEAETSINEMVKNKVGNDSFKKYSSNDISIAKKDGEGKGKWYTRPLAWTVTPAADDFHGLLQKLYRKGNKGIADKKMLEKAIVNPFILANEAYTKASSDVREKASKAIEKVKGITKNENGVKVKGRLLGFRTNAQYSGTLGGQKINVNQAIKAYMNLNDLGGENSIVTKAEKEALAEYVESNKTISNFIKEMSDLGVLHATENPNDFLTGSFESDLVDHIEKDLKKAAFADFNKISSKLFNEDVMSTLTGNFGSKYSEALQNSLDRMGGRQVGGIADGITQKWNDWATKSVATIMFLNFRSAGLQLLSFANYATAANSPKELAYFIQGAFGLGGSGGFKKVWESDFLKERRARAGYDVNLSDLATSDKSKTNKFLNSGFYFTSLMDATAIGWGGGAYYNALKKSNPKMSEKEILRKVSEQTEEAQQSSRPDRVSQHQSSGASKFILAFANTPAQYFRLTKKAVSDIANGRGNFKQNMTKIASYAIIQNAIFTAAQSASLALLGGLGDDGDDKEERDQINSMLDSLLRGMGLYGAVASTLKNVAAEAYKQEEKVRPDHIITALKATTISPPLSRKINDLLQIGRAYNYKNPDKHVTALAKGTAIATNLPTDWLQKKASAVKNLQNDEFTKLQKALILLGWSEYQFNKKNKKSSSDFDFNFDDLDFDDVDFDDFDF